MHYLTLLLAACGTVPGLRAMIFYSTADPTFNTTAPSGALANSGWQWVGTWQGLQGTPIGPHHFLAAQHIGGAVGDTFTFDGMTYTTTAFFDEPDSDLRICQVDGTFPSWAPLYRGNAEVGQGIVVFGRGVGRGAAVNNQQGALRGWLWGEGGGTLRWGENSVATIANAGNLPYGDLLYSLFGQSGGPNLADLAVGDSSGPSFINDGTGWKLAGVALAVDSFFNTTNSGNGFNAALFDSRGLYFSPDPPSNWTLIQGASPIPSGFYSTRVSVHLGWIDSIVPPTNDGEDAPALSGTQLAVLAALIGAMGAASLRRSGAKKC